MTGTPISHGRIICAITSVIADAVARIISAAMIGTASGEAAAYGRTAGRRSAPPVASSWSWSAMSSSRSALPTASRGGGHFA